jgi:hypothetical protein
MICYHTNTPPAARPPAFDANDWYRLGRALEIATADAALAASPAAAAAAQAHADARGSAKAARLATYDFRCVFLAPTCRWRLLERIDARCELMVLQGLLRETAALLVAGTLRPESMAGRAIGYRQAIDYLTRPAPPPPPPGLPGLPGSSSSSSSSSGGGCSSLELGGASAEVGAFHAFVDAFCTATRNYAGQQLKWFRKDPAFCFVAAPVAGPRRPRYPGAPAPPPPRDNDAGGAAARRPNGQVKEAPLPKKPRRGLSPAAAAAAHAEWAAAWAQLRAAAEAEAAAGDAADSGARTRVAAHVLALAAMDRGAYDAALAAAEQGHVREALLEQGQRMKTYASARTLLTEAEAGGATAAAAAPAAGCASGQPGGRLLEALADADAATATVRAAGLARPAHGAERPRALPDDNAQGTGGASRGAAHEAGSVLFRGVTPPTRSVQ